jgi:integrase
MKKKLTARGIAALKPAPPGQRPVIWDTEVANFGVRVTDSGKITFIVMRRVGPQGSPVRRVVAKHHCGAAYTEGLLTQAREDARAALRDMAQGVDPKQKRALLAERAERDEAERKATSFGAVAEDFIKRHVLKLRSGADVAATIRRELIPAWGDKPICEIGRRDVVKLIERVVDEGRPYVAHHLAAYLSRLFNWAIIRDCYGVAASPMTRGMAAAIIGERKPRQRVLTDAELIDIWRAARETPGPFGPFTQLLLVTGQRRQEIAGATWSEIDFDRLLWTFPPSRVKADRAHVIPLAPLAVEILKLIPRGSRGGHVFSTTEGRAPVSGYSKAKTLLDRRLPSDMPPWRYHDARRTVRTRLSALAPDRICELTIGHAQPGLHKIYDQHGYLEEKKRALDLWAATLLSIVEPSPSGDNIVRLEPARA